MLIPVAAAIALITAASSWAFIGESSQATQLVCPTGIIDAVTTNPVNDCAAAYQQARGTAAPRLVAYDTGNGGVHVIEATTEAPSGYSRIDPADFLDQKLIELNFALGDLVGGLNSRCFTTADAEHHTRAELQQIGLDQWDIKTSDPSEGVHDVVGGPSQTETGDCAFFAITQETQTVEIMSVSRPVDDMAALRAVAQALDQLVSNDCLDIVQARDVVAAAIINDPVVSVAGPIEVFAAPAPTDDCARLQLVAGGQLTARISGP